MVYDVFLNKIKTGMEQALGKEYELSLHRITKNNGLILDGLCISKDKNPVAPAIYLNNCYHQYLEGCFWNCTAPMRLCPPFIRTGFPITAP